MCFGTFDILHLGHLSYFRQAKEHGDYLVVVIARDRTKAGQNRITAFPENERLELVSSIKLVDEAVLGHHTDRLRVIREKKPAVICLGYDQEVDKDELADMMGRLGIHPIIKRMKPYHIEKHKSAKIKKKILKTLTT